MLSRNKDILKHNTAFVAMTSAPTANGRKKHHVHSNLAYVGRLFERTENTKDCYVAQWANQRRKLLRTRKSATSAFSFQCAGMPPATCPATPWPYSLSMSNYNLEAGTERKSYEQHQCPRPTGTYLIPSSYTLELLVNETIQNWRSNAFLCRGIFASSV